MKLFILLTSLFISASGTCIPEYLNSISICASFNNVTRTFINIKEIFDEYQNTGKVWNVLSAGSCLENNACKKISPVCAISDDNYYKTFPNKCLLAAEQKVTGKDWKIVYNGVCSLSPAYAQTTPKATATTASAPFKSASSNDYKPPRKSYDSLLTPTKIYQNFTEPCSLNASTPAPAQSNLNPQQHQTDSNSAPAKHYQNFTQHDKSIISTPAPVQYDIVPTDNYQQPHPYPKYNNVLAENLHNVAESNSTVSQSDPAYNNHYSAQSIYSDTSTPAHSQTAYLETVYNDQDQALKSKSFYLPETNNDQYTTQTSYTTSSTSAPVQSYSTLSENFEQTQQDSNSCSTKEASSQFDYSAASDLASVQSNLVPPIQQSNSFLNSISASSNTDQNFQTTSSISSTTATVQSYSGPPRYEKTQLPCNSYPATSTASQSDYSVTSTSPLPSNSAPFNQQSESFSSSSSYSSYTNENELQPISTISSAPASVQSFLTNKRPLNPFPSYYAHFNNNQQYPSSNLGHSSFNPTPAQLYSAVVYFLQQHFDAYGNPNNFNQNPMQPAYISPNAGAPKTSSTNTVSSQAYSIAEQNNHKPLNSNSVAAQNDHKPVNTNSVADQTSPVEESLCSNATLYSSPKPTYQIKSYAIGSIIHENKNATLPSNGNAGNSNVTSNYSETNNVTSCQNHSKPIYHIPTDVDPTTAVVTTQSPSQSNDIFNNSVEVHSVSTNYNATFNNSHINNVPFSVSGNTYKNPPELAYSVSNTIAPITTTLATTSPSQYSGSDDANSDLINYNNANKHSYENYVSSPFLENTSQKPAGPVNSVSTTINPTTPAYTKEPPSQYSNSVTAAALATIYRNPTQPAYSVDPTPTSFTSSPSPSKYQNFVNVNSVLTNQNAPENYSYENSVPSASEENIYEHYSRPVFSVSTTVRPSTAALAITSTSQLNGTYQKPVDATNDDYINNVTSTASGNIYRTTVNPTTATLNTATPSQYQNSADVYSGLTNSKASAYSYENSVTSATSENIYQNHSQPVFFVPTTIAPTTAALNNASPSQSYGAYQHSADATNYSHTNNITFPAPYMAQYPIYPYPSYPELSNDINPFEHILEQLQAIVAQNVTSS